MPTPEGCASAAYVASRAIRTPIVYALRSPHSGLLRGAGCQACRAEIRLGFVFTTPSVVELSAKRKIHLTHSSARSEPIVRKLLICDQRQQPEGGNGNAGHANPQRIHHPDLGRHVA